MKFSNDALSVAATGAKITVGATSASATIPNMKDGTRARYCRIATAGNCHVRWGQGAQTAVDTDMLLSAGDAAVISTVGSDTVAVIQDGTSTGQFTITPLEA
jgi:hypothetical protein